MSSVTCSRCGAELEAVGAECPSCNMIRRAPRSRDVSTQDLDPPPSRTGDAATIAEPPPSDVRPAEEPSRAERAAADAQRTITEPPPSSAAPSSAADDGSNANTLKTPDLTEVRPTKGDLSPSEALMPRPEAGLLLPSNRGNTPRTPSSGGGRSSLLQSGTRGPSDTGGELFDQGKYEILKEIARGGMGAVYKARQRDLNRVVALKVMLAGAMASEGEKKRFLREAEASAKLKHPNIVPVYDIGEVDGNLYFTMDFVEGAPLSEKKAELDRPRLLEIMIKVCDAVAYAHMRGIIHRDLKPANVMMDRRGEPLIMDFGLAKEMSAESESGAPDLRTREGSIMGTPHYMPPEQAEGLVSEIDVRSDVYALGVILYELWTGRLPFTAKRVADLMRQVVEQEPPSPRSIDPTVPWEVEAIALKAMEKPKSKRYETALDMKRDLERFKSGEAILARQASFPYRARKWVRRQRYTIAAAVLLAGTVGAAGYFLRAQMRRDHDRAVSVALETIRSARDVYAVESRDVTSVPDELVAARRREASLRGALLAAINKKVADATEKLAGEQARLNGIGEDVLREDRIGADRDSLGKAIGDVQIALHEWRVKLDLASSDLAGALKAQADLVQADELLRGGRLEDARKLCLAATQIGEEPEAKRADKLLASIQQAEESKKTAEARRLAAEIAASVQKSFAELPRTERLPQHYKPFEDLLTRVREGRRSDRENAALAKLEKQGELALADILAGIGAFELAAGKPREYANDADPDVKSEAERIARDILRRSAAAQGNRGAMDGAEADLARARTAALASERSDAALAALTKLQGVDRTALGIGEDRKHFEGLVRSGVALRLDALADTARARVSDPGDPVAVDAAFQQLADQIAGTAKLVPGVDLAPEALGAATRAANGSRGRYHLRLATATLGRGDSAGAVAQATIARDALRDLAGFEADSKDAQSCLARATTLQQKPEGMILVGEASLELGGDVENRNPLHAARVQPFYIGRCEVTNAEFKAFVEARTRRSDARYWGEAVASPEWSALFDADGVYKGPEDWEGLAPPRGREEMPVARVSLPEARAFARWKGTGWRLPTDDEWEVAARVKLTDERGAPLAKPVATSFPWGDELKGELPAVRAAGRIGPDGANPKDVSPVGCRDMAGNVAEWVEPSPGLPERKGCAPVRGGSFLAPVSSLATPRHRALARVSLREESVGFRLAKDLPDANRPREGGK